MVMAKDDPRRVFSRSGGNTKPKPHTPGVFLAKAQSDYQQRKALRNLDNSVNKEVKRRARIVTTLSPNTDYGDY